MEAILNNSVQENLLMSIGEKNDFEFEILERFLTGFKNFKVDSNSYITYRTHIKKVYDYYVRKNYYSSEVDMLKKIDIDSIEKFFIDLKMSGKYKPSTFNLIRSANYEYFKYLKENRHLIEINPIDVVSAYSLNDIEESKKEKETLTVIEMKELIKAVNTKVKERDGFDFNSARDTFLYTLLFTSGLRVKEALNINLSWIEETEVGLMINIPKKFVKNKIDKRNPIVNGIREYYYNYLEKRNEIKEDIKDKNILFVSKNGFKLATTDVNYGLIKNMKKTNIDKHISSHCFRHSLTRILKLNKVDQSMRYKILCWSEKDIESKYSGKPSDPIYDKIKHDVCNIL